MLDSIALGVCHLDSNKKISENLMADHLSRLESNDTIKEGITPINEWFQTSNY